MERGLITKSEIDELYRKVGVANHECQPMTHLNLGTMSNKLANTFKGAQSNYVLQEGIIHRYKGD